MTDVDPLVGAVLEGRYRVIAQLGAGGMGTVYRAEQTNVGREVAVKVLLRGLSEDLGVVQRFQNEAKIIAQLRSPHTLRLIDSGETATKQLYIVTELLVGETLNTALKKGPVGERRALEIIRQVCHSLEEAHAKGIIHRDLKPANVFVEQIEAHEHIKILDFGIAKLSEQPAMTATGMVFGTPAYMSPEQARGESVGTQSDLYSLGVIAYECVGGRPPFVAESVVSLLLKHTTDPPPPFAQIGAKVSAPVEALVMKMLSKAPERRPMNAAAARREAEAMLAVMSSPSIAPGPVGSEPRDPPTAITGAVSAGSLPLTDPRPPLRRRTPLALILAVISVCMLGIGVALLFNGSQDDEPYPETLEPDPEMFDPEIPGDVEIPAPAEVPAPTEMPPEPEGAPPDVDVVDLERGTVNDLGPEASQEEIKRRLPYFTGSTAEGADFNEGGGVFFTNRDFYFYTNVNRIEVRSNFQGEVRPPILAAWRPKVLELLGDPESSKGDDILFVRPYGCLRIEFNGDTVSEIDLSAKSCQTLLGE